VGQGDELTLIVPGAGGGIDTHATRFESLQLVALLETGTELDQAAAIVQLGLASELAGLGQAVSGLRVATNDLFDVSRVGWELMNNMPSGYYATNWMMTHGNLYAAIQLSRDLITVLLFSIIAVAAFNVVSSLVLVVFDKQSNIAILRTLGAAPRDIAIIFVLQGAMIGLVGVTLGAALGALGSQLVPDLVSGLERLLNMNFLNTDVYPVSFLPVDLLWRDVLIVGAVAFAMCVVAAIYPALRAARLAPAVILNQDRS
jgi:lipoprotein-releasing system permease protein